MLELTVIETNMNKQPRCDFVVILHKKDVEREKISERDEILLENTHIPSRENTYKLPRVE